MQTTWSSRVGYRSVVADPPAELIEACGNHRVILVKSLDQAAGYGGDWFAVKQYARQHGLIDAEAMNRRTPASLIKSGSWRISACGAARPNPGFARRSCRSCLDSR